jgi:hypothetical protein
MSPTRRTIDLDQDVVRTPRYDLAAPGVKLAIDDLGHEACWDDDRVAALAVEEGYGDAARRRRGRRRPQPIVGGWSGMSPSAIIMPVVDFGMARKPATEDICPVSERGIEDDVEVEAAQGVDDAFGLKTGDGMYSPDVRLDQPPGDVADERLSTHRQQHLVARAHAGREPGREEDDLELGF